MRPELFVEMAAVQQRHWWYAARREILSKRIQAMKLPAAACILEIGCGTGGNLHMLAQHGALSAMEYDEKARALANTQGACEVRPGGLPHVVPFADASFDLVDHRRFSRHCRRDRRPGRRVRLAGSRRAASRDRCGRPRHRRCDLGRPECGVLGHGDPNRVGGVTADAFVVGAPTHEYRAERQDVRAPPREEPTA